MSEVRAHYHIYVVDVVEVDVVQESVPRGELRSRFISKTAKYRVTVCYEGGISVFVKARMIERVTRMISMYGSMP